MLILSRHRDEVVYLGHRKDQPVATCRVVHIRGDKVRLGFDAPAILPVHRREIIESPAYRARQPGALVQQTGPLQLTLRFRSVEQLQACLDAGFCEFAVCEAASQPIRAAGNAPTRPQA